MVSILCSVSIFVGKFLAVRKVVNIAVLYCQLHRCSA